MINRRFVVRVLMTAAVLSFAGFVGWGDARADVFQTTFSSGSNTRGSGWVLDFGQGFTGSFSAGQLFVSFGPIISSDVNVGPSLEVEQYSNSSYTTVVGDCIFEDVTSLGQVQSAGLINLVHQSGADFGLGCLVEPSSYVQVRVFSNLAMSPSVVYGSSVVPSWVIVASSPAGETSVSVPYFYIRGVFANNSPYSIDWTAITPVPPFTLGTSSTAIAASSSLWSSISFASTSLSCSTGNIFSDAMCSAGAFLFIPSPTTLEQYAQLPQTQSAHFPFSWLYEAQSTIDNATSSTGNLPAYSMDLFTAASTTFASTTMPNFMPSFTFFSSTEVFTYLPAQDWVLLQSLLAAVLWLGLVVDIFFTLRGRFHRV